MAFASGHHDLLEPSASGRSSTIWGASGLPLLGLAGHLQFAESPAGGLSLLGASGLPLLGLAGHPDFSEMPAGRL